VRGGLGARKKAEKNHGRVNAMLLRGETSVKTKHKKKEKSVGESGIVEEGLSCRWAQKDEGTRHANAQTGRKVFRGLDERTGLKTSSVKAKISVAWGRKRKKAKQPVPKVIAKIEI